MIEEIFINLVTSVIENISSIGSGIEKITGGVALASVIVIGAIVVLLVSRYAKRRPSGKALKKKLKGLERIVILTHANPDLSLIHI